MRYDQQVDESRAVYVFDLIRQSSEQLLFREQILAALGRGDDQHDRDQLFELAAMFAKEGDQEAKAVIDQQFRDSGDLTAAEHIVRLDGVNGLVRVAESIVDRELLGEDCWIAGMLTDLAEDQVGADIIQREFERASRSNPRISAFVDIVRREREDQARAAKDRIDVTTVTYDEAKQRIRTENPGIPLGLWGELTDPASLERAAHDLLAEDDPRQIRFLLWIFTKREFPLSPEPLISLARSEDEHVARWAWRALAAIEHPAVRALAVASLDSPVGGHKAVNLFARNYRPGDHVLVERDLNAERDEAIWHWHWLGMGALEVFETNPVPECAPILLKLYETDPCTVCRRRAVVLLDRLGALPSWIVDECQYDASPHLREIARNLPRSTPAALPGTTPLCYPVNDYHKTL